MGAESNDCKARHVAKIEELGFTGGGDVGGEAKRAADCGRKRLCDVSHEKAEGRSMFAATGYVIDA